MKVIFDDIPSIKLSYNQKLILKVLKSDFRGRAFGPQMLDETDDEELKKLTINQITWNMLRLRENGLVESEKKSYQGRILNEYKITNTKIIIIKISSTVSFLNSFTLLLIASSPIYIKNPTIPPIRLRIISSISNTLPI